MFKIGLSTCERQFSEGFYVQCRENNITHMEISQLQYEDYDFYAMKKLTEKNGITLNSLHLPYAYMDISSLEKDVRENSIKLCDELIKKAADIGINKFIIHPSGEPVSDNEREERKKYSREMLSVFADMTEKSNAVLCVEDLPRSCIGNSVDEMKYLIEDDDRLKVCFDTNHIFYSEPQDVIRALGDRIVTLHVSDFDYIDEKHWLPGEGKIEWNEVVSALNEINYSGVWLYELTMDCPSTIIRDRDLTCEDIALNAKEIFSGKKPTVFLRYI